MKVIKINLASLEPSTTGKLLEIPKIDLKKGTKIQFDTIFGKTLILAL